ncbi:MAG: hypothetical protein H6713_26100 [Myxococcales bacterium]|nr:hypothetical protein [Myxococcales bacterium]
MSEYQPPPGLADFIAAARAQSVPQTAAALDVIHEGARERRRQLGLRATGVGLLLAAGLALVWSAPAPDRDAAEPGASRVRAPAAVALAEPVTVTSPARVDIEAPWRVRVGDGEHHFAVAAHDGDAALRVDTPGRAVLLREGAMRMVVAGDRVELTLERGAASWIEREGDGGAVPIAPADASPSRLAAVAEQQLAAGASAAAVATLRTMVLEHPDAVESSTALLDLGQQLARQGERAAASCAYQLYLRRYPKGDVRGEVTRALARSGRVACDELDPRE